MAQEAQCVPERAAMVETIQAYARIEASVLGPRGIAVAPPGCHGANGPPSVRPRAFSALVAYMERLVLIGQGQTISQPFIVALMTDLAAAKFDDTVLEVGTGSGYQAAVLARLVRKVCTVEIIPPLGEAAANVLKELGYDNVSVKIGDGYEGWPECGPFDAVIVTAALGHVPPPLIEQLRVGGRLVMPLGPADAPQQLTVIEKVAPSETRMRSIILGTLRALYPLPGLIPITPQLFAKELRTSQIDGPAAFAGHSLRSGFLTLLSCRHVWRFMLPAADQAGNRRAEDGRKPEQPELGDVGSASKQRRAGASRWVDRSVGDRDQEQVNER